MALISLIRLFAVWQNTAATLLTRAGPGLASSFKGIGLKKDHSVQDQPKLKFNLTMPSFSKPRKLKLNILLLMARN